MINILTDCFEIVIENGFVKITPVINGVKQTQEKVMPVPTSNGYSFQKVPYVPTADCEFRTSDLFDKLDMKENVISIHNVAVGNRVQILFENIYFYNSITRWVNAGTVQKIDFSIPFKLSEYTRRMCNGNVVVEPEFEIKKSKEGDYYLQENKKDIGKIDIFNNIYYCGFVVTGKEFGRIQIERPNFKW